MAIMWSDYIPDLLKSPKAAQIGFAPIPGTKSMLGGATFFLNRSSKHPQEAIRYVLSLMTKEQQVQLAQRGSRFTLQGHLRRSRRQSHPV